MTDGVCAELRSEGDKDSCDRSEPHEHLLRFILPLPSYVPLPDREVITQTYPAPEGQEEPFVVFTITTIHQIHLIDSDWSALSIRAASAVVDRIQGKSDASAASPGEDLDRSIWLTVADVVTNESSPDPSSSDWDGSPQNLRPRQDSLMRAIHSVREIARTVRLTGQSRVLMPTYERLLPLTLSLRGIGTIGEDGGLHLPEDHEWSLGDTTLLEHTNVVGWEITDPEELRSIFQQGGYWNRALESGTPAVRARELMLEARALLQHQGEYALAVVVATTAIEVLATSIVSALLWEEQWTASSPFGTADVAGYFAEGQTLSLVKQQLIPRLGGSWTTASCPWQRWIAECRRLRNRIVHGGHEPTRAEVQGAIDSVDRLQTFMFDRLAARATRFPRVTLMLVSQTGLEERNLWHGQIKRFAREEADHEAPWMEAFGSWHEAVIEAANP